MKSILEELILASKAYVEFQSIGNAAKLNLAIERAEKSIQPNGGDRVVSENEKQEEFVCCETCDCPNECSYMGCAVDFVKSVMKDK